MEYTTLRWRPIIAEEEEETERRSGHAALIGAQLSKAKVFGNCVRSLAHTRVHATKTSHITTGCRCSPGHENSPVFFSLAWPPLEALTSFDEFTILFSNASIAELHKLIRSSGEERMRHFRILRVFQRECTKKCLINAN